MSLRAYLVGLSASSVLCWIAFTLTLVNTNPSQGGQAALLSLYISLFIGLLGTLTLAGYFGRRTFGHNELKYSLIVKSFRQAFILSGLFVGLLLLQAIRLLAWWDILLLMTIALLMANTVIAAARKAGRADIEAELRL